MRKKYEVDKENYSGFWETYREDRKPGGKYYTPKTVVVEKETKKEKNRGRRGGIRK